MLGDGLGEPVAEPGGIIRLIRTEAHDPQRDMGAGVVEGAGHKRPVAVGDVHKLAGRDGRLCAEELIAEHPAVVVPHPLDRRGADLDPWNTHRSIVPKSGCLLPGYAPPAELAPHVLLRPQKSRSDFGDSVPEMLRISRGKTKQAGLTAGGARADGIN